MPFLKKSTFPIERSSFTPMMSEYGGPCRCQLSKHTPIPQFRRRRDLQEPPDLCLHFGYLEGA